MVATKSTSISMLSQMARDYLAVLATSVPSEQIFSEPGDIITKKRNQILVVRSY